MPINEISERLVPVTGGHIRVTEQGEGPLVLLVHGFPEGWRSWRHQLRALAAAGYRAAAIDVRGYGGSSCPDDVEAYRMTAHVADNVAVVHALGAATATVIGHDWGAPIAATSALLRPDVFTAVGLLGVPYTPRAEVRPTDAFRAAGGDEEFYVSYFQRPGRAETEIGSDIRGWVRGFYVALAAGAPAGPPWFLVPRDGAMRDRLPVDAPLPGWIDPDDFDAHVAELEAVGLAGPLGRYRNMDRDWEDLAAFAGRTITQPSIYIAGALDSSTAWLSEAVERQAEWLPGLAGTHLLEGCGHWVQQERPDEVNDLLVGWLRD